MFNPPNSHRIEILIDKKGNITSTVTGIAGPSCAGIADWLKDLGQITDDQNTEDFYKDDNQGISFSAGA